MTKKKPVAEKPAPVAKIRKKPLTAAQKKAEAKKKAAEALERAKKPYILAFFAEPNQQSKTLAITEDTKLFIEQFVNSGLDAKLQRYFILNDLRFYVLLNK